MPSHSALMLFFSKPNPSSCTYHISLKSPKEEEEEIVSILERVISSLIVQTPIWWSLTCWTGEVKVRRVFASFPRSFFPPETVGKTAKTKSSGCKSKAELSVFLLKHTRFLKEKINKCHRPHKDDPSPLSLYERREKEMMWWDDNKVGRSQHLQWI